MMATQGAGNVGMMREEGVARSIELTKWTGVCLGPDRICSGWMTGKKRARSMSTIDGAE